MPRFEAQVWVSGKHPYQVEVNAANVFAAKEQIVRRENVKEREVQRIFPIQEESSSSSSSGGDSVGSAALVGGICALAIAWWLLPWVASGAAGYGAYKVAKGRVSSVILAGIIAATGVGGFLGGKAIKGEFDSPTPAVIEEVKEVEEAKPLTYVDQTGETVADNQDNFRLLPDGSKVWY
jgi:hypothetical protein